MLSLPSQQPSPAPIILDIALDNWSIFHQSFKLLCFTKFGVAGQQILSNCAIPLTPFATAPSKFDLDRTDAGIIIPDQFSYARRQTTAEEIALPGFNLASISLTECSNRELRDDLNKYTTLHCVFSMTKTPFAWIISTDTFHPSHTLQSKLIHVTLITKHSLSAKEALSSMVWPKTSTR